MRRCTASETVSIPPRPARRVDAIVLAAGRGTRLAPLTTRTPKPLLPVGAQPLLLRLLDQLEAAGIDRAVVVTHHLAQAVQEALQGRAGRMAVEAVDQGEPRGTGHAVAAAAGHVDGDCLLLMGDCVLGDATVQALADADGFIVAADRVDDARRFGVLEVDGDRLTAIHEKPETPPSDLVNTGAYRLPASALEAAQALKPSPRGELEFTDVLRDAIPDVRVVEADRWLDVGTPWDLLAAHELLLPEAMDRLVGTKPAGGPGDIEDGVRIHGRLYVAERARVRSGTYVEGDVWVGPGADVGPNAYLRGPVQAGAGCRVGAATEVKNSVLLDEAKAPHHNYVGDSLLGHGCNLGSGTKIANLKVTPRTVRVDWDGTLVDTGRRKFGAVVGDGVKTGVNCSLDPGVVLGAGMLLEAAEHVSGWVPCSEK